MKKRMEELHQLMTTKGLKQSANMLENMRHQTQIWKHRAVMTKILKQNRQVIISMSMHPTISTGRI